MICKYCRYRPAMKRSFVQTCADCWRYLSDLNSDGHEAYVVKLRALANLRNAELEGAGTPPAWI